MFFHVFKLEGLTERGLIAVTCNNTFPSCSGFIVGVFLL